MSFCNYSSSQALSNIKIEETNQSNYLQLNSNTDFYQKQSNQQLNGETSIQILKKITDTVVHLHEIFLNKCSNIEIYRDLTQQQQHLLASVDQSSCLHTTLAGILAVDSCVQFIQKEEKFIVSNLMRGLTILLANFKEIEAIHSGNTTEVHQSLFFKMQDSLKYLVKQIHLLPSLFGREAEMEKHKNLLEEKISSSNICEQEKLQIVSEITSQNDILKLAIKEKQIHIINLENKIIKLQKSQKVDNERKTSHTQQKQHEKRITVAYQNQKSSESSSVMIVQQYYEEITHLKEQLLEKNNIVIKMNEEFAFEMQKYNSTFKRLEDQNQILKKYNDIDTVYMLEELEYELDALREQKKKDQAIIAEVQRKINGISYSRNSRICSRTNASQIGMDIYDPTQEYDQVQKTRNFHQRDPPYHYNNYQQYPQQYYTQQQQHYLQQQQQQQQLFRNEKNSKSNMNRYGKHLSPNYVLSSNQNRHSPLGRQYRPLIKEPQEMLNFIRQEPYLDNRPSELIDNRPLHHFRSDGYQQERSKSRNAYTKYEGRVEGKYQKKPKYEKHQINSNFYERVAPKKRN